MRYSLLFILSAFLFLGMPQGAYAASSSDSEGAGGKEYVKMDPLVLPIVDNDGVHQVISMVVSIEVETVNEAEKVKLLRPKLTDAYIQDMYGSLHKHAALQGGIVRVDIIKKRLNKVTDKILGKEIDSDVLLQVVQQRPI
ncbi:MAG: flagellar basal body-associated FliL family protein [Alphaproteobacteria bacterium]